VAAKRAKKFSQRRVKLGNGLSVSPICLGVVGDPSVVTHAFDAGINFFFLTADMHWPYYEPTRAGLAQLLAKRPTAREQIVVAGTAYVTQPEFYDLPFREIVQNVPGLDHLDVLVAGGSYGHNLGGRLPVLARHRQTGFCGCRAIGASFHERDAARWAVDSEAVDLAFVRFNALHPGAASDLFPHLPTQRSTRVFNFNSTQGFVQPDFAKKLRPSKWVPRITDHYRLALSQPGVDGLLVALDDAAQVDALVATFDEAPLSLPEQRYLVELAHAAVA